MTAKRPPNIVLILTDHFRADCINRSTPNLLALAERGALMHNTYCGSTLCQPSRVSIVTGRFPSQHGVCGNMAEPVSDKERDDAFMRHLQAAGYYTALIGKHHYIDHYGLNVNALEDDDEIKAYGFDHVEQVLGECGLKWGSNECRFTQHLRERGVYEKYCEVVAKQAWAMGEFPFEDDCYDDGFIGMRSKAFVEQYDREQPFYLNVGFHGPHPPYWHPGDLKHDPEKMWPPIGAPDTPNVRRLRAHFMDKCSFIDREVGKLMDALKHRGMLENTVVIFTSDHGDMLGDFGIVDKRVFYEPSAKVPMIVAGPGLPRGERDMTRRDSKALTSLMDLYPTMLELAGVESNSPLKRWGRSLLPVIRNEPGAGHQQIISELATSVMVRTANWKLVFDAEQDGVQQLFNLRNDPRELANLAGVAGYEATALDLMSRLASHRISMTQYTHDKEERRVQRVRVPGAV